MNTGFILDIFIICLLASTTVYCVILNRKLKALHQGQEEFFKLISRFDNATKRAEANIKQLRGVDYEIDENFDEQISTAHAVRDELRFLIDRSAPVADRLMTDIESSRKPPKAPLTTTPPDEASDSVVESGLLEALREARKG